MTTIALVDDHVLLRSSLSRIISNFEGYLVLFEADNGQHFIDKVNKKNTPDIVLLDISMPVMNGFETAEWIKKNLPDTKVLVLSMMDNETTIIRMINLGASGYILKDSKPVILKEALDCIIQKGFYSNDLFSSSMLHYLTKESQSSQNKFVSFNGREKDFIKYACTEMTYKEIADIMKVSPRTIDMHRDVIFEKLNIKSRVGLVLYAIKEGFVQI